jgi:general secretion pathway protein K
MQLSILGNNRGIALLMTLAFTTLAISMALETNRQSRFSIEACAVHQERSMAGQMAAAGVHAAMAVLVEDRYTSETDHLKEAWADPEQLNETLAAIAFEEGRIEVAVEDESARLQINALVDFPQGRQFVPRQQRLLERMLEQQRDNLEAEDTETTAIDIVNALKDWLDSGDDEAITGLNGAESDYYQALDPPYSCTNGPMRHIGELGRIKGVGPALMDGTADRPGLAAHLTVHGAQTKPGQGYHYPGVVNLNTVSLPVLQTLLPPETEDLAEIIIDFRENAEATLLESSNWFQQAPGAADAGIDQELIAFASDLFRISATAYYRDVERKVTAVVQRVPIEDSGVWSCKIIDWESD